HNGTRPLRTLSGNPESTAPQSSSRYDHPHPNATYRFDPTIGSLEPGDEPGRTRTNPLGPFGFGSTIRPTCPDAGSTAARRTRNTPASCGKLTAFPAAT